MAVVRDEDREEAFLQRVRGDVAQSVKVGSAICAERRLGTVFGLSLDGLVEVVVDDAARGWSQITVSATVLL